MTQNFKLKRCQTEVTSTSEFALVVYTLTQASSSPSGGLSHLHNEADPWFPFMNWLWFWHPSWHLLG